MITTDSIARFTWGWNAKFLLETDEGCFIWSDPDYGGDNVIRKFDGTYVDWCKMERMEYGRDKGYHRIADYCPNAVIES